MIGAQVLDHDHFRAKYFVRLVNRMRHSNADPSLVLEPVDLARASKAFRTFYEAHFEYPMIMHRREVDWNRIRKMRSDELALARRLVRANLDKATGYLDAAGVLNDREAIPLLHRMLRNTSGLSERITIARPLWFLERTPEFPLLIEKLVRSHNSRSAMLKEQHIWEILLLGDKRAMDHLFTMAEDKGQSVRDLALFHLTDLSDTWRTSWLNRDYHGVRDLAYFQARRSSPRFVRRVLANLAKWHTARPLFD